jgi:Domain of unknown function (DUF4149)
MREAAPEALPPFAGWPVPVSAILLAAWLGATLYFSIVVTRAAFAVLPTRTLAGALVGHTLPVLYDSGMAVGAILVGTALLSRAGTTRNATLIGGAAMFALTAIARFIILPRIERLRLTMPAVIESLPVDDPARRAFGQLHAMSVSALGLAMLVGVIVAIVLAHSLTAVTHE